VFSPFPARRSPCYGSVGSLSSGWILPGPANWLRRSSACAAPTGYDIPALSINAAVESSTVRETLDYVQLQNNSTQGARHIKHCSIHADASISTILVLSACCARSKKIPTQQSLEATGSKQIELNVQGAKCPNKGPSTMWHAHNTMARTLLRLSADHLLAPSPVEVHVSRQTDNAPVSDGPPRHNWTDNMHHAMAL
jgi:hypothetical protein